ncbi:MAG: hypothetical protein QNJ42_03960 [Crocosphaera sp.]|nr:hypothetical protein [Crocosphaera sp.]
MTWVISGLVLVFKPTLRLIEDLSKINQGKKPPEIGSSFFYILFLVRIPLISALILGFLPYFASQKVSKYLKNVFIMESGQQLAMAIFMTFLTAIAISSMMKTIILLRCPESNNKTLHSLSINSIILLITLSIIYPTYKLLQQLNQNINLLGWDFDKAMFLGIFFGIICLVLITIFPLLLEKIVIFLINSKGKNDYNYLKLLRILTNASQIFLGVLAYLLVIFLNYPPDNERSNVSAISLFRNFINHAWFSSETLHPPTLIYALSIILIITILIGGLTYYWDLFFDEWEDAKKSIEGVQEPSIFQRITNEFRASRFPVILFLIIFSASSYGAFQVDHYFKLNESKIQITDYQKDLQTAIGMRLCPDEFKIKTHEYCESPQSLVIVAASGGGIQASGWTTKVLAELQGEIGKDFTKKTALISSVSGGSVGTMFYLDNLENRILSNPDKMVKNAQEDRLGSVGWGLAFPDLFRFIGLWELFPLFDKNNQFFDRGYALEKSWELDLKHKNQTLDDWYKKILQGDMPIPIFNATLVENGRRFLISPMKLISGNMPDYIQAVNQPGTNGNGDNIKESKALDLKTLFNCGTPEDPKQCTLSITTAARLSASFPYVSPLPRNYIDYGKNNEQDSKNNIFKDTEKDPDNKINCLNEPDNKTDKKVYKEVCIKQNYHIADGGYFDNGGTFTAIERLDKFLNSTEYIDKNLKPHNFFNIKKIVLLNINAFPEDPLQRQQQGSLGYINAGLGAVGTLNSVRDATQIARNIKEADLLKTTWNDDRGIKIKNFTISFPYAKTKANQEQREPYDPPLSWRLTEEQKRNQDEAWKTDPMIRQTVADMKKFWQEEIM